MGRRNINVLNYKRKDLVKRIRVVFQLSLLATVLFLFLKTVIYDGKYRQPEVSQWDSKKGFVALTFPEVTFTEKPQKITKNQLSNYLKVLYKKGYKTISQKDIIDYYQNDGSLPEKALFIMVDSSSKSSVQFAQPILDKFQYKASILSYGSAIENPADTVNIRAEDIEKLKKTGFWEFGTNGYRLAYINVFGKDTSFSPILYPGEFPGTENTTYYNHYLMDFIRDQYMIPMESRSEMEARINTDYKLMNSAYMNNFGFMPELYVLMNSNTSYYGSNKMTGQMNISNIQSMFKINFNKEGSGFNNKNSNIYDLTRIQVNPEWFINHLIMRLKQDVQEDLEFIGGKEKLLNKWELQSGAPEFIGNDVILTSPSGEEGKLYLKDSDSFGNVVLNAKVPSDIHGRQSFYLKTDNAGYSFIRITFQDKKVLLEQKVPEGVEVDMLCEKELADTSRDYRDISISTNGNHIWVTCDNASIFDNTEFDSHIDENGIALSSKYSEAYKGDGIYDSVFRDVCIFSLKDNDQKEEILYDNRYSPADKVFNSIKQGASLVINWFIENF